MPGVTSRPVTCRSVTWQWAPRPPLPTSQRPGGPFQEFLQTEIDGLTPDPDADVDGFIIQWGRYSWHARRMCVSFTRQLAVPSDCDCGDLHEQPDYWQVDLALVFDDAAGLAVFENGYESDTGFYFEPAGARRDAAIAEAEQYQQLQAAFRAMPLDSALSFERV